MAEIAELDAIIAGLTENQRWTIKGEHEKSGVYHLGHAYLPNKWMTLHSNRVIDGIIKRGLTRKRTNEETHHALFVEKRSSVGHECLNELGVQVAERMAALTDEIGYVPDADYFKERGIKAK